MHTSMVLDGVGSVLLHSPGHVSGRRCQIHLTSECKLLHNCSVDGSAIVAQDRAEPGLRSKDNGGVGAICWSLSGTVCGLHGG